MRKIFTGLTAALALAVVVQVFLAGNGVFTGSFDLHRILGYGTLLLAVAVGVTGVLARIPRNALRTVGLVTALIVLQPVLARLSTELGTGSTAVGGLVLGLHAANALVISGLLGAVLRQTWRTAPGSPDTRATVGNPIANPPRRVR